MLTGLLHRAVRRDATRTALVFGRTRIDYAELERRVARCAAGLRDMGVGPGD